MTTTKNRILILFLQERNDMDKLARVMFLLLCHVTSITKQLVFYLDADRIDEMISGLDGNESTAWLLFFQISFLSSRNYVDVLSDPLYNQPVSWQKSLLTETAVSARRLLRVYSGTAVITCTLWIIFPILYYSQGLPVEFPFWTNLDHRKPVLWVSVLL